MRHKILLGIVIFLALVGLGYVIDPVLIVGGLVAFGAGFFIGRRQGVSR